MNLTLQRIESRVDGIFSCLYDDSGNFSETTLEHSYSAHPGFSLPKIPNGVWKCVRSKHHLDGMIEDFETFEILVPGHTNLLFHWGNWETDSDGCVLLGERISNSPRGQMIIASRPAFQRFMDLEQGVQEFDLTVL